MLYIPKKRYSPQVIDPYILVFQLVIFKGMPWVGELGSLIAPSNATLQNFMLGVHQSPHAEFSAHQSTSTALVLVD